MKIVLAGGGSGGHVTPLKAIATQIKLQENDVKLHVITDRGFYAKTNDIFQDDRGVEVSQIVAGKIRRYHGKSKLWHFTHIPTLLRNIRDLMYIFVGGLQSFWLLIKIRPDVVFCKGGFVCVPVGFAARILKIDVIIHDSDTKPGLTNKLLSGFAKNIATGMPTKFYPYDKAKTVYTGMPVNPAYRPVSKAQQAVFKQNLGFDANRPVVLVTGGGNGSDSINKFIIDGAGELIARGWGIIQMAGSGKAKSSMEAKKELPKVHQKFWQIEEFSDMVPRLLAADIVLCRTSASTLQESANAAKPVVGIPSPNLSDQIMNAQYFASEDAIIYLKESDLASGKQRLLNVIEDTFASRTNVGHNLHSLFSKPDAAKKLASIILESGKKAK